MKWLRLYHEARNDAKLESLADDEFRVWFKLLCFANEQEERGLIAGFSERLLAVEVARGDKELLERTLTSLEELRVIERADDSVGFMSWGKRQFESDNVSERVQKHRKRQAKRNSNNYVTDCNVTETPPEAEAEADTDSDTEIAATTTAREAKKTAEILTTAPFVTDDLETVRTKVERSFELSPDFKPRDGPILAEKFSNWRAYLRKPPKDWYQAWLNWLRKERNDEQRTPANGRTETQRHDPASQIRRPGQFDDLIIRSG